MPRRKGEIGKLRREQIIDAAVAIIAEKGLQHLSLSVIEQRAGMSRGQLTYYFHTKEQILLAVFERMIETIHQRAQQGGCASECPMQSAGWERIRAFLSLFVLQPPDVPEFHALQYTFLSQVGHREDFRARLANLYEEWRSHMAEDFSQDLGHDQPRVSARTLASFVQALLHGLAIQRAAEADSYDRNEMLTLCVELLSGYLGKPPRSRKEKHTSADGPNGRVKRTKIPG